MLRNPEGFQIGVRLLHLTSPPERVSEQRIFSPQNRQIIASTSLSTQVTVKLNSKLEWYSEAVLGRIKTLDSFTGKRSPLSYVFGPVFQSDHLTVRANYRKQGSGYLPVLGYFLGDRRGPTLDATLHLGSLSLTGSWLQTRNNVDHNPDSTDFFSRQAGGGFNWRLPARFSLSGSFSQIGLESRAPELGLRETGNRLYQISVNRPISRHNLRTSWQRSEIHVEGTRQVIQSVEMEDNFTWMRFTGGGAVRWQSVSGGQEKDSLFYRGSAQLGLRNFSLYGYLEQGKDIVNESLFSTNIVSTSVFGVSWSNPRTVNLRLEAFRSNLNTVLNPESIFFLGSNGLLPDNILNTSNNWSLYLRMTRQLGWGEPMIFDRGGVFRAEAPLTGTLAGYVRLQTMGGESGASQVCLVSDFGHRVMTDENGHFQIPEIPKGLRSVKLDLDRLPADLSPVGSEKIEVAIQPDQLSRVELEVEPLQFFEGYVKDDEGNPPTEGAVVRLTPGERFTTTDQEGWFGFFNLPEGDYEVELVADRLSEKVRPDSLRKLQVLLRYGMFVDPVLITFQHLIPQPKPIRKVLTADRNVKQPLRAPVVQRSSGGRRVITSTDGENDSQASAEPSVKSKRNTIVASTAVDTARSVK